MTQTMPDGYVALPPGSIAALVIIPFVVCFVFFLVKNIRNPGIKSLARLYFKRGRVIRADIHTLSNRLVTRYIVPDANNSFRFRKALYKIPQEGEIEFDSKYHIPKYDFIELQIFPESGNIVYSDQEMTVKKKDEATGQMVDTTIKAPQLLLSHAKIRPKLLKLARRDENGKMVILEEPPVQGVEVAEMMDSKIVNDVNAATLTDLKIQQIFIVTLIVLGIVILGDIALYAKISSLQGQLQTLTDLLKVAATGGKVP